MPSQSTTTHVLDDGITLIQRNSDKYVNITHFLKQINKKLPNLEKDVIRIQQKHSSPVIQGDFIHPDLAHCAFLDIATKECRSVHLKFFGKTKMFMEINEADDDASHLP